VLLIVFESYFINEFEWSSVNKGFIDMSDNSFMTEINKRRTFAIISHPDAGKTTITEKMLLFGNAIQLAGTVKGKKNTRKATSDWMKMEQDRGISITTSVMQFPYKGKVINLLDTPGHEDFSEDTYRTLTAVDSVLMVIDGAKGVEDRTIKLMDVCRLRDTPIFSFVNKMDRETRDPIEVMDEIESVLKIKCSPINWPIGMGNRFKGVYNLLTDTIHVYLPGHGSRKYDNVQIDGLDSKEARDLLGDDYDDFLEEILLVKGASHEFDEKQYLKGELTPVFFGTALSNFGVREMMNDFIRWAPAPIGRLTNIREVLPPEEKFTGFVFKIQANMDPRHRDRIAFLRVCSGRYEKNMKIKHVRTDKIIKIADAVTFLAGDREQVDTAIAGDVIGLHNHGTIQIGDTFTEGEILQFTGIPHFSPELFRRVRLKDPLRMKQLQKGLKQLSEEGATQLFMPFDKNDLILGAVGVLQFDVVQQRLKEEYKVDCIYEDVNISIATWVDCDDKRELEFFCKKCSNNLAYDAGGYVTYLAPTRVNLELTKERWDKVLFKLTREH